MAQPRGQGFFLLRYFTTFTLLQLLSSSRTWSGKPDFEVSGHGKPVPALVGEDAELACHLSPNMSAEDMELWWYRDQLSPAVHVHKNGSDLPDEQMPSYQGRTTFLRTHLAQGKATVRIHNISAFDNGTFHCLFKAGNQSDEATLWLQVAGVGSNPRILVQDDHYDHEVRAKCTSEDWYPQPDVSWTDLQGRLIPAETNFSVSPVTGLFTVESRVTIQDRAVEDLFCYISSPLGISTKADKFDLSALPSWRSPKAVWKKVLPLLLAALMLEATGVLCFLWRHRQERGRQWQEAERTRAAEEPHQQASPTEDPAAGVTLDPDTASPTLSVSEDGKSVTRLAFKQEVRDHQGRFDVDPCVLGLQCFSTGRHYWEVQVGLREAWNVGVCQESVERKGRVPKSPKHGIWALEWYNKKLRALTYPRVRLQPVEPLSRVGMLLDCDSCSLSFLRPDGSLIYTFSGLSVMAPLRPFFCLWTLDPTPLTICSESPLTQEARQG